MKLPVLLTWRDRLALIFYTVFAIGAFFIAECFVACTVPDRGNFIFVHFSENILVGERTPNSENNFPRIDIICSLFGQELHKGSERNILGVPGTENKWAKDMIVGSWETRNIEPQTNAQVFGTGIPEVFERQYYSTILSDRSNFTVAPINYGDGIDKYVRALRKLQAKLCNFRAQCCCFGSLNSDSESILHMLGLFIHGKPLPMRQIGQDTSEQRYQPTIYNGPPIGRRFLLAVFSGIFLLIVIERRVGRFVTVLGFSLFFGVASR